MKKLLYLLVLALIATTFYSCEDDDVTPTPSIVGYWLGSYKYLGTSTEFGYAMLFRSDGTVRVYNGSDTTILGPTEKAEGTYIISDSVRINFSYIPNPELSAAAKLYTNDNEMVGTFGYGASTAGGGTFTLIRQ